MGWDIGEGVVVKVRVEGVKHAKGVGNSGVVLDSGDKQEEQFIRGDCRVEGGVFGRVVEEGLEMGWEIGRGDEAGMEEGFEFGNVVSSWDAIKAKHGGKDGGDGEGSVTMDGVSDCAGIEGANGGNNGLFEEGGGAEKVIAFGEGAGENVDSGMGGVVGRVGRDWVGWARDEERVEGVGAIIMQVMSGVLGVRHAEGHGTSGVMGDAEGTCSRPDGAEPVIVVKARVGCKGDGDSNRGIGRGRWEGHVKGVWWEVIQEESTTSIQTHNKMGRKGDSKDNLVCWLDRVKRDDDEGQDYIMSISLGYEEASWVDMILG
jgi:hypothetical protein